MAEISLREYLEKVDTLWKSGKSDEVVLHSRQILQYFPKNAAASRFLGQAMVRGSDFEEAEPILRRVLAVFPDDVGAHSALSDYNDRRGKADEAIWHLERALETTPNDPALVEKLRELYQRYRKIEDPRFQLTTGAVARQYIRNGLYPQAIETLQTTLEKLPRRVDLRLLLAQTLWGAGMEVESGEIALDVLDILPFCLEANRILTLLWLAEGRPSDAQRYLNQIQEVDPYAALQLAQDSAPDDEAFTLPELDYRRIAETQLARENPDWLTDIDQTQIPEPVGIDDEVFGKEVPDTLLDELDAIDEETLPEPASRGHTGYTGLLSALDLPEDDELIASEELPDWLMDAAPEQELDESLELPAESDPLDWMQDTGTELAGEDADSLFDLDAETQLDMPVESLDLDGLDVDENEVPDFFGDGEFDESAPAMEALLAGDEDPLAWLEGSGIELLDESEQEPEVLADQEDDMIFQDPETIDPLAWMDRSGVELVDEESADLFAGMPDFATGQPNAMNLEPEEDITSIGMEPGEAIPAMMEESPADEEEDSLDWLQEAEPVAEESVSPQFESAGDVAEPDTEQDNLSWLQDESILEEMLDIEELSDTGGLPTAEAEEIDEAEEGADIANLAALGSNPTDLLPGRHTPEEVQEEADWQVEITDEQTAFDPEAASLSSFEWFAEDDEGQAEIAQDSMDTAIPEGLEWMTELPEEAPEWLAQELDEAVSTLDDGDGPEWLVEEPDEASGLSDEFSWLADGNTESAMEDEMAADEGPLYQPEDDEFPVEPGDSQPEETPDWLTELESSAEAAEGAIADEEAEPADIPDWLSAAAPAAEDDAEVMAEVETSGDAFDWMEMEEEPEASAESDTGDWLGAMGLAGEAEPADIPDWLSEAAPVAEEDAEFMTEEEGEVAGEIEPAAEAEVEMTTDEEIPAWEMEEDAEAEPADIPDWLSEAAPVAEEDAEFAGEIEPLEPEAEIADTPEWVAEEDAEFMGVGEQTVDDSLEFMAEEALEPEAETADIPNWLSEAAPVAEEDAEVMAEDEEAFDWGGQQEAEIASVTDSPDWLQDLDSPDESAVEWAPEEEAEVMADTPMARVEDIDWGTDEDEEELEAVSGDSPDWLQDLVPAAEAAGDESFDWSDEPEEAAEEMFEEQDEAEFAGMDEEEETFAPEPYVRPAASIAQTRILPENDFGWPGEEDEPESEPVYESDLSPMEEVEEAGIFAEEDDMEEKILASAQTPPPADNAPDWLNAMVPGLDLDYDAVEDDRPIESTYVESAARRQQPDMVPAEPPASQDIRWLNAIVDEETGPMRAIRDVPQPIRSSGGGRFIFSRPPIWLRVLEQAAQDDDGMSQAAEQDDDFELPDWLR